MSKFRKYAGKTASLLFFVFIAGSAVSCKKAGQPETVLAVAADLDSQTISATAARITTNGIDDKRAELQALINSYASKEKTLVLPNGVFVISDELILPSHAYVVGSGSTEIILTAGTKSGRNVVRVPASSNYVKLKNIKINANQAQNTGADLVGLFATDRINTLTCENVIFAGGRDRGVIQIKGLNEGPTTNVKITGCKFIEAGRTAIELRGTKNTLITNCTFSNWGTQNPNSPAIQLQSQDNINVQIVNNTFNNTSGIQFAIECAAAYVIDSKITGNKLNDPNNLGGNGISGYYKRTEISNNVLSGGNGNQRSGLEIFGQDNTIIKNTISAGGIVIAPGLKEDGMNILIKDNTVITKGVNSAGIQMGNGGYNLKNITVSNNTVDTRQATGNSSAIVVGTYGIPRVVTDITVEENTLYSNAFCIRLQSLPGSSDIYLTKNICKAGMSWLGIITNSFTNIQASGNIKEMSNKGIIYSVPMPPVIEQ